MKETRKKGVWDQEKDTTKSLELKKGKNENCILRYTRDPLALFLENSDKESSWGKVQHREKRDGEERYTLKSFPTLSPLP